MAIDPEENIATEENGDELENENTHSSLRQGENEIHKESKHSLEEEPTTEAEAVGLEEYDEETYRNGEYGHYGMVDNEEDEDEEEYGREELVLEPNDRLMATVQQKLKEQLLQQKKEVSEDIREKSEILQQCKREREDLGVKLYGFQQQLVRTQSQLEESQDHLTKVAQSRGYYDKKLNYLKENLETREKVRIGYEGCVKECQDELDKLNLLLQNFKLYIEESKAELKVVKRVASKTSKNLETEERMKERQDIVIDRLSELINAKEKEVKYLQYQANEQAKETTLVKSTLNEAQSEIESIQFEKNQILNQWKFSLIGMQRRDEVFAQIRNVIEEVQNILKANENEMLGVKTSIVEEQAKNEKLSHTYNRIEGYIAYTKRKLTEADKKELKQRSNYSNLAKALKAAEEKSFIQAGDLADLQNENMLIAKENKNYRAKIQAINKELVDNLSEQSSLKIVDQGHQTGIKKIQSIVSNMNNKKETIWNEMTRAAVAIEEVRFKNEGLKDTLGKKIESSNEQTSNLAEYEQKLRKSHVQVEVKQRQLDALNKQIAALIENYSGQENSGPLESEIANLQRAINQKSNENLDLEQFWLKHQQELIEISQKNNSTIEGIGDHENEEGVLFCRKQRLDIEIENEENEISAISKRMYQLQNQISKIQALVLGKGEEIESQLKKNRDMEKDTLLSLKKAEKEMIVRQREIEELVHEKDSHKAKIVEIERQCLLWEKKIQLGKEIKEAVDPSVGASEITTMKKEIYRMKLRLKHLKKVQTDLIKKMEMSIKKRGDIAHVGKLTTRSKAMTSVNLKKGIKEYEKKLMEVVRELNIIEKDKRQIMDTQKRLGEIVDEKVHSVEFFKRRLEESEHTHNELKNVYEKVCFDSDVQSEICDQYEKILDGSEEVNITERDAIIIEGEESRKQYQLKTIYEMIKEKHPGRSLYSAIAEADDEIVNTILNAIQEKQ
eukprot:Nk52_evm24s1360 gene=Nk52_evmTU24s1360